MFACFCLLFLFFNERRFYGESAPFGKKSHKTAEILGYLNSQQALADYAILIRSLKQNLSSEASPVVVFGGSYGGTWFRLKYPHIAIGALASSAPILQFDNIVPLTSFYDAISQDFKDASVNCFKVIKRSWEELDAVSNMKHGLPELSAHHADESQGSYERRPRVAERAEEARGGHYRKVDHSSFWEGFSQIDSSKICKTGTKSDCHLRLMIYYRLEEETHRPFSC
ncbi:unnamed protein product [Brassica rapa subsp. trilocularis]